MSLEITGRLEKILPIESGTSKAGKDWVSQSVVLNTGDQYNPNICIKFFGNKSDQIQNLIEGETLKISINVSSREFNDKWYHSIDGWRIEKESSSDKSNSIPESKDDTDLPF